MGTFTITNQRNGEPIVVRTFTPGPIIVHRNVDGTGYTVTHERSGKRIFDTRTLKGAKRARVELLTLSGWENDVVAGTESARALGEHARKVRQRIVDDDRE